MWYGTYMVRMYTCNSAHDNPHIHRTQSPYTQHHNAYHVQRVHYGPHQLQHMPITPSKHTHTPQPTPTTLLGVHCVLLVLLLGV